MLDRLRPKLTYANVVSSLCLFAVLGGGTAYAVTQIDRNSVKSKHIVNEQVRAKDLAPDQVVTQIAWRVDAPAGYETLFERAGLRVDANCPAGEDFTVLRATNVGEAESIIGIGPVNEKTIVGSPTEGEVFSPGANNTLSVGEEEFVPVDDSVTSVVYGNGEDSSPVVTATFLANRYLTDDECKVVGTVLGG
jgi:hypothetical protein